MKRDAVIPSIAVLIGLSCSDTSAGNPWSTTDSLSISRANHRTVALQDGGAIIVGGGQIYANYIFDPDFGGYYESVQNPLYNCERFDPISETWSETDGIATPRFDFTATLLDNGKVLITGGLNTIDYNNTPTVQNSAELYDPDSGTWTSTPSMNYARDGHTATLLQDGKVLVVGGSISNSPYSSQQRAEIYNPSTGSWTNTGSLSTARYKSSAVRLNDGRVMVLGGESAANSVEIYDPSTGTWSPAANLTVSGSSLLQTAANLLPDGRVLAVVGGYDEKAEVRIYDPSSDVWTDGPPAPFSLYSWQGLDSTPLPAGDFMFVNSYQDVIVYDSSEEKWFPKRTPSTTADPGTASMSTLSSGKILRTGGAVFDSFVTYTSESTQQCEILDPTVESGILSIEFPEGTPIEDGGAAIDLGTVPVGGTSSITITVRNLSPTESLANIYSSSFYNSNLFPVTPQPGLTLAPGATGTFTITFTPNTLGPVSGEDRFFAGYSSMPFTLNLTGTGGTVSATPFDQAAALAGLIDDDALPDAIPFHDGVPNLLKFAFGLNLAGPDARRMTPDGTVGLPTAYLHENGGTVWRVEYLRRKNSGLTYTPKKSTTLADGSFVPLTGTPVESEIVGFPDWQRVTVDEPYNPATTPKMFTVVEVILNQP